MYPVSDKVSKPIEVKIPVLFRLNKTHRNSLSPDFNQLRNYNPFTEKYLNKLKLIFDVAEKDGNDIRSGLKRKFEALISSGKYRTVTELAKISGYSNS
jgi:hypothetical protein